jgi:ligand-binding sensor domain-containing protein
LDIECAITLKTQAEMKNKPFLNIKFSIYIIAIILVFCINTGNAQIRLRNDIAKDSFQNSLITAMDENVDIKLIGTNNGFWHINKKNKEHRIYHYLTSNSRLPSDQITSICIRKNNTFWVGTNKGIFRWDGFAELLINQENSNLPDLKITSIVEDANEDIWVGTFDGGLWIVHHRNEIIYNAENSNLPSNRILSLSLDENKSVVIHLENNQSIKSSSVHKKLNKKRK